MGYSLSIEVIFDSFSIIAQQITQTTCICLFKRYLIHHNSLTMFNAPEFLLTWISHIFEQLGSQIDLEINHLAFTRSHPPIDLVL